MTINDLLTQLDHAAMTIGAPDGRRVLQQEANSLRAHVERANQRARYLSALRKLEDRIGDTRPSLQEAAQLSDLRNSLSKYDDIDVAARMAEAQRTLELWT